MKKLLLLAAIILVNFVPLINAQWVQTNGPYGGTVNCFAVSPNGAGGTNLFAGADGGGVSLSTDSGISWKKVNSGLTNNTVNALAVSGTNLFAGTRATEYFFRLTTVQAGKSI